MCRYALFSQAWSQYSPMEIWVYLCVFMYHTIKKIGSKKTFDKFGKLQQFAKFIINFTNSTTFPMQTDFNLPKIFYQTPYNPYSLNLLLPEIFTIR